MTPYPLPQALGNTRRSGQGWFTAQPAIEVVSERFRGLIPLCRLLFEAFEADRLEVDGNGRIELTRRDGRRTQHLIQQILI